MKQTWIVVAESARARILATLEAGGKLRELADLTHPESRLHDRELTSDLPGRAFDSHGEGRHGMEPSTSPREHEVRSFAAEIAAYLERGRHEGSYDRLVLVAPPRFLGLLRAELTDACRESVIGELDKNLVQADMGTLADQVTALLD